MNIVVRQFPPSESCKMRVILLSRYGTWDFYKETTRRKEGRERIKDSKKRAKDHKTVEDILNCSTIMRILFCKKLQISAVSINTEQRKKGFLLLFCNSHIITFLNL